MDHTIPALACTNRVLGRLDPMMRAARARGPVSKVRTVTGDEAWLVTRLAELNELLMDPRLGKSHPDPETMPRYVDNPMFDIGITRDPEEFAREHREMRSALTPLFSARRMARLRERVAGRVTEHLDRVLAGPRPVDLHGDFAFPLSFRVLCDLVGLDDTDGYAALLFRAGTVESPEDARAALDGVFEHLRELAARKRREPGEDLVSTLCASVADDATVARLTSVTSFAFLVTPGNLSAGLALFAMHQDQWRRLVTDPELMPTAVEEVLRLARFDESCMPRYALADIDVAGVTIRTGDLVLCDHYSTGFDDRVFDDPERFDIGRTPNPHLAFSRGPSFCIGAPLARLELQEAFAGLAARLPRFELAVPDDGIPMMSDERGDQVGGSISALPITW